MKLTGLKRPAFYVHFRDKYDLALRVVQDIGQELFTLANHWLKGNNFPEDSLQALQGIVNVYQNMVLFNELYQMQQERMSGLSKFIVL